MKHFFKFCLMIFFGLLFSSCISHKDTVYLQENEDTNVNKDLIQEMQKPYRVQINDILNIQVKSLDQKTVEILNPVGDANLTASGEEKAFFNGFTVDLHGNIRVPTLGYLNVLGRTTAEIQTIIEEKLLEEQFKKEANIFVTVKLTGLRYTANGEVNNPSTKVLYQERVNIFEAIANVGEINEFGNRKDVIIIRQYPQGQKLHHLDLTDINVMQSPYYYIQPNDIIYVKPVKQKTMGTGRTAMQTLSSIATILSLATTSILLFTRL